MNDNAFSETVAMICDADTRYDEDAYFFIRDALDFVTKGLKKPANGPGKHISGGELFDGIRVYALREFGPMAYRVLTSWGLSRTDDFGELVFNLVEAGVLGKTDEDKREDFAGGYDFVEAFVKPFVPQGDGGAAPSPQPATTAPGRTTMPPEAGTGTAKG